MNDNKILTIEEQNKIYYVLLEASAKLSLLENIDIGTKPDEFFVDGVVTFSKELKNDLVSCVDIISSKDI